MADSELRDWLEQLSDTELDELFRDRQVAQDAVSLDAVAAGMRTPAAIDAALARTTAFDLRALRAGTPTPSLQARGLEATDDIVARIPELPVPTDDERTELTADERRSAADRAVAATITMSGAVSSVAENPVVLTSRGIALAREQRARAAELSASTETWEALIATAKRDALLTASGRHLFVTRAGSEWLAASPADRWQGLSKRFLARRTLAERALLQGGATSDLRETFPLANEAFLTDMAKVVDTAERLGLLQRGLPSGIDRDAVAERIPEPIDYVYLQPDLTVVAPGPLRYDIADRIAAMAAPESRGVASSWRLTPASVQHALALGINADALLADLEGLSLTGVPQPVQYLVRDTERRFGTLLVQEHGTGARVTSDADTHKRLLVDRALLDLRLRVPLGDTDGKTLVADVAAEEVVARLIEARYPALLADAAGEPVLPQRTIVDLPAAPPVSSLTARLRGHGIDVSAVREEWLLERLATAVKQKTPLKVTVLSASQTHETTIVPLSIMNGRLRGRDVEHDLERTLPLRAIAEIAGLSTA